jgi:hypothetical protein
VAASPALKSSVADDDATTPDGPSSIVATGATVSTIHVRETAADRLPDGSFARTSSECAPCDRPEYVTPDRHEIQPNPSRLHSKDDTGSFFVMLKIATVDATLPEGRPANDTSGAVVSVKRAVTYIVPTFNPVPNVQIADAGGASSQSISPVCGWSNPTKRCPPAQPAGTLAWISGPENAP